MLAIFVNGAYVVTKLPDCSWVEIEAVAYVAPVNGTNSVLVLTLGINSLVVGNAP